MASDRSRLNTQETVMERRNDIGGRIRHAREQRGLSLQDAARQTKLSMTVLRAIERNDFTSLPEGLYRKAYLRTLSAEVGLDPNEMVNVYRACHESAADPTGSDGDSQVRDECIDQLAPSPRRSVVTLAVVTVLAVAWFGLQRDAVDATASVAASADAAPEVPALAEDRNAGARRATISERPGAPLRIEIVATDWCWIDAESDGRRTIYRLVSPGEHIRLEGQRGIALRLGNAGSVMVSINEGVSRSPGRIGEVVEMVVTPDNVESLRDNALETAAAL